MNRYRVRVYRRVADRWQTERFLEDEFDRLADAALYANGHNSAVVGSTLETRIAIAEPVENGQ